MVGSVFNEGVRGMATSYREMQKSAHDIARANIDSNSDNAASVDTVNQASTLSPVNEANEGRKAGGLEESLIDLRRQEQIFTANAKVVQVAADTLGSIIDVKSWCTDAITTRILLLGVWYWTAQPAVYVYSNWERGGAEKTRALIRGCLKYYLRASKLARPFISAK